MTIVAFGTVPRHSSAEARFLYEFSWSFHEFQTSGARGVHYSKHGNYIHELCMVMQRPIAKFTTDLAMQ